MLSTSFNTWKKSRIFGWMLMGSSHSCRDTPKAKLEKDCVTVKNKERNGDGGWWRFLWLGGGGSMVVRSKSCSARNTNL